MNNNETRTLWLSIGAGMLAAFMLYSYSQEKQAEFNNRFGAKVQIVVARQDINEMQTIDDSLLDTIEKPKEFVEPGYISDVEEIVGQVAGLPILKGQQILKNHILSPGPDTGISRQVAPQKRAWTMMVDDSHAVARLIRPGDRVDVVINVQVGLPSARKWETKTLFQDIVVLATGSNIINNLPRTATLDPSRTSITTTALTGDTSYTHITLELTPKEVQDLSYLNATSPGNVYLALRNPSDRVINRLPKASQESVMGLALRAQANARPITRAPVRRNITPPKPKPTKKRKSAGGFVPQ